MFVSNALYRIENGFDLESLVEKIKFIDLSGVCFLGQSFCR